VVLERLAFCAAQLLQRVEREVIRELFVCVHEFYFFSASIGRLSSWAKRTDLRSPQVVRYSREPQVPPLLSG
jgi:hypothetical protein